MRRRCSSLTKTFMCGVGQGGRRKGRARGLQMWNREGPQGEREGKGGQGRVVQGRDRAMGREIGQGKQGEWFTNV